MCLYRGKMQLKMHMAKVLKLLLVFSAEKNSMFYQRLTRPELGAKRLSSFKTDNLARLLCRVLDGKVV